MSAEVLGRERAKMTLLDAVKLAAPIVMPIVIMAGGCWAYDMRAPQSEMARQIRETQEQLHDVERRLPGVEALVARYPQDLMAIAERLERLADRLERRTR